MWSHIYEPPDTLDSASKIPLPIVFRLFRLLGGIGRDPASQKAIRDPEGTLFPWPRSPAPLQVGGVSGWRFPPSIRRSRPHEDAFLPVYVLPVSYPLDSDD